MAGMYVCWLKIDPRDQVTELGGVTTLIKPGDMSNTISDEKVRATFVGYLADRLLDLFRNIKVRGLIC